MTTSGRKRNSVKNATTMPMRVALTNHGSAVARIGACTRAAVGKLLATPAIALSDTPPAVVPGLEAVAEQQNHERRQQHDEAEARGAGVVVVLEFRDDE